MEIPKEQLQKYITLSLMDDMAPQEIFAECNNDESVLLLVAENILENIRRASFYKKYSKSEKENAVTNLLRFRCRYRDKHFTWTEEYRKRFLHTNNILIDSCKKAWEEAVARAQGLEHRINQNDSFLKDYEIYVNINVYPTFMNGGETFEYTRDFFAEDLSFITAISHSHYKINFDALPLFVDKTKNWNTEYLGNKYERDYICYAVHRLLDTGIWCFEDVISIQRIWTDINVVHQNCFDLQNT